MAHSLKDLVKGNVYFVEYCKGNLWYEAGRHSAKELFLFPVPITEATERVFLACDKAILYKEFIGARLEENSYYGDFSDYYCGSLA